MQQLPTLQASGKLIASANTGVVSLATGCVTFANLQIDNIGMYILKAEITSYDQKYKLTAYSNAIRVDLKQISLTDSTDEPELIMTFDGDYDSLAKNFSLLFIKAMLHNFMLNYNISPSGYSYLNKGSVIYSTYVNDSLGGLSSFQKAVVNSKGVIVPYCFLTNMTLLGNKYSITKANVIQTSVSDAAAKAAAVSSN